MIALAPQPPNDDEVRRIMEIVLPITESPTTRLTTQGREQFLPVAMLDTPQPADANPAVRAQYTEMAFLRATIVEALSNQTDYMQTAIRQSDAAIEALRTAHDEAGVVAGDYKKFLGRGIEQIERTVYPQGPHDLMATFPKGKPDAGEIAARKETAKVLEEVTGLNVEILPRDDYNRQYYQFTVKHKDESKGLKDEPLVVHQLHDYVAGIIRDSGAGENARLEMSPKDDWYSSVKVHFGGGGGFSLPPKEGLEEARRLQRGIQAFAKARYKPEGMAGYQKDKLDKVDFIDGNERQLG